ncbi:MAG: type I methionyl aminopeptidase, partial [Williamsia herbipolensis]|nr:type I methionyl aminopeptidase [Williamsia herbipolensis]
MTAGTGLQRGTISPWRDVPAAIARPHYVDLAPGTPADFDDAMVKDADTIARMRVAGRIAGDAVVEVGRHVAPGVTTDELDRIGHEFLVARGAYPSTLGYKGYPKSLCTSVNEVICHGIPDSRPLEDGDVVKVDITAFVDGVHGDTCATFYAGDVRQEVRDLGERTREAMLRGVKAVAPGRPISVIGRVIESYARRFGYGVVRDYTGHGVGPSFHT